MPLFWKQNVHSLKNTLLSCQIFKKFHETPPQVMPIYGQKSVNSANILSKTQVHSQKTHCSYTHISSTNVCSLKNSCIFFLNLYLKNPLFSCLYLVKKTSIMSKLHYIMGQKSQQDALFFPIFHEKITTLMPTFCQKNVHSLKKTLISCPYFVRKTSILSKTQCSYVIFFQFFL